MNIQAQKYTTINEKAERVSMLRIVTHLTVHDYQNLCRAAKNANQSISQFSRELIRKHVSAT
jgi:hypothetical protein